VGSGRRVARRGRSRTAVQIGEHLVGVGSTASPFGEPSAIPKSATPANISCSRGVELRNTRYSVSSTAAYWAGFTPTGPHRGVVGLDPRLVVADATGKMPQQRAYVSGRRTRGRDATASDEAALPPPRFSRYQDFVRWRLLLSRLGSAALDFRSRHPRPACAYS